MMEPIAFPADIRDIIVEQPLVMLLFFRKEVYQFRKLIRRTDFLVNYFPELKGYLVDLDKNPSAARMYSVFQVPSVLLYVRGKITVRQIGDVELDQLKTHIETIISKLKM